MITVNICGDAEKFIIAVAAKRGISVDKMVNDVINKYLAAMHTIDKDSMAKGYEDMGEINLNISEGNAD